MNWKLLEERALTGFNGTSAATGSVALAQNVWSTVYVDALAARDRDADGSTSTQGKGVAHDGVTVSSGLEERTFIQTDANFNVTSLVSDATDTVVERYAYLPYGQAEVLTATWSARPATAHGNSYRFQGLRLDAATGLHRARFRDYADWLGRWTQQDPAGWPDGVGRSEAFGSSSISNSDPMGLSFFPPADPRDRYQYTGALLKFRQLGARLIIKNDQLNHDFHGRDNVSFLTHSHLPNLLNQSKYYRGTDSFGNRLYTVETKSGKQAWLKTRQSTGPDGGTIEEATGDRINSPPRPFYPSRGLNNSLPPGDVPTEG